MTNTPTPLGRRIVVGVDGSPSSIEALEWAAWQAAMTNAGLEILAAWDWAVSFGWAPPIPSAYDPETDIGKVVDQAVGKVRASRPDLDIRVTIVHADAGSALVDASEGADLVVVGNRGHGEVVGMLLGSVSEHCVAHAHCPVVVMR